MDIFKSHIFISSPFKDDFRPIWAIITDVANKCGIEPYLVDREKLAVPIADTIERKIRESRIVIADISGNNPNVLHEIGQAQALGKPLIIITQDEQTNAPFNVKGLHIERYQSTNLDNLRKYLKDAFSKATSRNETLRSMLVPSSLGHPTKESRFVIAASPLSFRRVMGRSGGYEKIRRTSSDYVGIRGILQAFGLLYGFETLPDLIDVEDYQDKVIEERMNLYCIASPKANRLTGKLLDELHKEWVPHLDFRPDPTSRSLRNVKVSIFSDKSLLHPPGYEINTGEDRYWFDFGLIIRGPNHFHNDNMMTIIAGRSSLGTEAACQAFIDNKAIEEIRHRLAGLRIDMEDHRQAFYALVSMERDRITKEANPDTLTVDEVQKLRKRK